MSYTVVDSLVITITAIIIMVLFVVELWFTINLISSDHCSPDTVCYQLDMFLMILCVKCDFGIVL